MIATEVTMTMSQQPCEVITSDMEKWHEQAAELKRVLV